MRTALVIGTGLMGTSVALALTARGVRVYLEDHDAEVLRVAEARGAGRTSAPEDTVDLAVIAVPPAHIAATVAAAQKREMARGYLDVGSVKSRLHDELSQQDGDLTTYLGSHPMSGREQSGPMAADKSLFEGRPWVLTPGPGTLTSVLNLALELTALCGAVPVVMDADSHDRAVALVSHTPQLLSSLAAARLAAAEEGAVRLSGQGIRDVTRIAASDPGMWLDILSANPGPVADVLADVAADLDTAVRALRALESAEPSARTDGAREIESLLRRGNPGQQRVPGKHGAGIAEYETVVVQITDRPGELARIFADAGGAGVNIEDVRIEHATAQQAGRVQLTVDAAAVAGLRMALLERGWPLRS